jgi:hypothetical protein
LVNQLKKNLKLMRLKKEKHWNAFYPNIFWYSFLRNTSQKTGRSKASLSLQSRKKPDGTGEAEGVLAQ